MVGQFHVRPWLKRLFIAACVVTVAIQWIVISQRRAKGAGDFDVLREFGRRFLARENLYGSGLAYNYLPTAAMYFAPFALMSPGLGIALRYAVAVSGLCLTIRWLRIMVGRHGHQDSEKMFSIAAITLVLASHYVIRDLDDGGLHLILLTVLVGAIFCVWRGRIALGAVWFGLATTLKAPAGLFLPFFLWKRQWRLASLTAAATVFWIIIPSVWMGHTSWWGHQQEWRHFALESIAGNPRAGVEQNEQRVQNQALRPAFMRYLVTYPEGHSSRPSHPAYISILDLDPMIARHLATGITLALLAVCAWLRRHGYGNPADPAWLLDCSAVLILSLLLSPITWVQHMVLIVPALYLIVTEDRAIRRLGQPATVLMCLYVLLSLVLNREILGKATYLLLLGYGVHTLALLVILGVILFRRPTADWNPHRPIAPDRGRN